MRPIVITKMKVDAKAVERIAIFSESHFLILINSITTVKTINGMVTNSNIERPTKLGTR